MQVLGVVGTSGAGTTATAVDLASGLRRLGHHAAVLDLTGDVAETFDVRTDATLADALGGDATAGHATATVEVPHGDVDDALDEYVAALGRDETAFRAGDIDVDPGEAEPTDLPVVVGGDRSALAEVDAETLSAVRADLEFAYDYLVTDAGTLGPAVARFPDQILVVTDPREESLATAERGIEACKENGLPVAGVVVNRATDETDVSAMSDRLGVDILAVIPADERTPAIEPVVVTAPKAPAALAYERLVDEVLDDGGDGSGFLADETAETGEADETGSTSDAAVGDEEETAAHDDATGDPDDTDDGGLLGRFSNRFR